ncbi:hypothetical protein N0V86_007720 [Didymella sp. IMI 355093]|nr:hypothetical protein N0V86_007720 [Didymella sp. IMI 355093]
MTGTRAFAFDYEHSGKLDHVVIYSPEYASCAIIKPRSTMRTVFWSKAGWRQVPGEKWLVVGDGLGPFDLQKKEARMFSFDYDHSGKQDHLACYEPGHGTFMILKHDGSKPEFTEVYRSNDGIGGYNMRPLGTRCFAFDYNSSGKCDHIVLYEPGSGTIWIVKHGSNNEFSAVYQQGCPGSGIADCTLQAPSERLFAYDFKRTRKMDHLVVTNVDVSREFAVLQNNGGTFSTILRISGGVAGFNMGSPLDRIVPVDMRGPSGNSGQLILYRPGETAF